MRWRQPGDDRPWRKYPVALVERKTLDGEPPASDLPATEPGSASFTALHNTPTWTLVVHGPSRRRWGFYLPTGWMLGTDYDRTVRAERRDLYAEITSDVRVDA